ncbi:hypothetical protein GPECTOR_23g80 [Gonium pectorale]|uniref:CR-type domain-containing protein n=1 Tax=Gonium pectorale TaxID=33097 RepID=A0A150GH86_GONPE|nr:hypothetical protein GPECTOR_23g80 [Gonium pectorale]|eukprot:KXZ49153.1 hypothetical protein GPECTOR_23g80 [Gonium pectorale]
MRAQQLSARRNPASSYHVMPAGRRQLTIVGFKASEPRGPRSHPLTDRTTGATDESDVVFKKTVDVLLNRAASSLTRGTCTCLSCRGGGAVSCPHCKGTGRLATAAVERADVLRGAFRRLRAAVGLGAHDVPYASSEWMRTNRCLRCHGQGRLPCEMCSGSGLRYPHLDKNHWRQCAGQPGAQGANADNACDIE